MRKLFSIFAALTLSVGLWAAAPANVESVDLGLPSGLKWATFNVGATAPEGNGDYFAWGETEPYYSSQDPLTWKTGKETGYSWQSYCGSSSFDEWSTAPYDATTKILKPEFDAATANWGSDWRMPTKAELDELKNNCTWTWTEDYNGTGIKGYVITSKAEGNTNFIFLPTSGYRNGSSLNGVGSYGRYWSSSLFESYSGNAYYLEFNSGSVDRDYYGRYYGYSVRPVTTKSIVLGPKVGDQFVDATSGLKFEVTAVGEANTVMVIANNYTGTSYTIPATVKYKEVDFAVTAIGAEAFFYCSSLESITISEGVTTIGVEAFYTCSLVSVNMPASVTTIGENAFYGCTLQSVTFAEGSQLTTIGSYAFSDCALQPSITIPAGVTTIGSGAFAMCSGLTSVTFLGNACQNNIGEDAFYNVGDTETPATLVLPDTWTGSTPDQDGNWYGGHFDYDAPAPVINERFVDETSGLKFKVTAVGEANTVKVLANDYKGTSYTIPATVKYKEVDFAVTSIGAEAFFECESLESITISEGVTSIGGETFYSCSSLVSVNMPASVTTIGESAFHGCALQSINLPANLTTIEHGAFSDCALQSITIPASVTEIESYAFADCSGLTSVIFLGNACQDAIGEMAFSGVGADAPALLTLHGTWAKENQPDEDGNWYGGKFELSEDPTALPTLFDANANATKFLDNGQVIIRKNNKTYNTLGQEIK